MLGSLRHWARFVIAGVDAPPEADVGPLIEENPNYSTPMESIASLSPSAESCGSETRAKPSFSKPSACTTLDSLSELATAKQLEKKLKREEKSAEVASSSNDRECREEFMTQFASALYDADEMQRCQLFHTALFHKMRMDEAVSSGCMSTIVKLVQQDWTMHPGQAVAIAGSELLQMMARDAASKHQPRSEPEVAMARHLDKKRKREEELVEPVSSSDDRESREKFLSRFATTLRTAHEVQMIQLFGKAFHFRMSHSEAASRECASTILKLAQHYAKTQPGQPVTIACARLVASWSQESPSSCDSMPAANTSVKRASGFCLRRVRRTDPNVERGR